LTAENIELRKKLEDTLYVHALCALANEEANDELGRKVKAMVKYDPRYIAYVNKLKVKAIKIQIQN
jgi:hypothetical protein